MRDEARPGPEAGPTLVVGVGNLLLGDEGFGVHVVRGLLSRPGGLPPGFEAIEAGTDLLAAAGEMAYASHLVVVDAVRAGGRAGTLYRAEWSREELSALDPGPVLSLHDRGLLHDLRDLLVLRLLPPRVTLLGAEPLSLAPGTRLSSRLSRAADRLTALLLAEAGGGAPASSQNAVDFAAVNLSSVSQKRSGCSR